MNILREVAGSRECARKISELSKPCDVFASADYLVIDNLLIPEYAEWNIHFIANEMAIVYRPESRRAAEITPENWFDILLDPNVAFGRSDPNSDPCGYRAIFTMKLAEQHYSVNESADKLLGKKPRPEDVALP